MSVRHFQGTTALLVLCLLGGCISIGGGKTKPDDTSIYTLHPPASGGPAATARNATVVVAKPDLPAGLATDRIALEFNQGARMDYYADVKWSASLDELLQEFLVQSARHDLTGLIVGTPELAAKPRFKIAVRFTDFAPVYAATPDSAPTLTIALTLTVVALPAGTAQAQFNVRKTMAASANTVTAITKGLETLLQSALAEGFQKAAPALRS